MLERTLEAKLREAGTRMTAPAFFETLAPVHLNMIATGREPAFVYDVTDCPAAERVILDKLGLQRPVDENLVAERLTPRTSD